MFVSAALGHEVVGCFSVGGTPFAVVGRTPQEADEAGEGLLVLSGAAEGGGAPASADAVLGIQPAFAGTRGQTPAGRSDRHRSRDASATGGSHAASTLAAIVGRSGRHVPCGCRSSTPSFRGHDHHHRRLRRHQLSQSAPAVKLFGCVLMLAGAALLATLFGIVTDAILPTDCAILVRRPPTCGSIVVGGGHIAERIVGQLNETGHGAGCSAQTRPAVRATATGVHAIQEMPAPAPRCVSQGSSGSGHRRGR